jgi:hypothetical protein
VRFTDSTTTTLINNTGADATIRARLTKPTALASTSGTTSGGLSVYLTPLDLPTTGSTGDQSYVESNTSLYIYDENITGWYRVALINQTPTFTSTPNAEYVFATDGTPIVVTPVAVDPEGALVTYSVIGDTGTVATMTQDGNAFTLTPSTDTANAGSFSITFRATDGTNVADAISDFSLEFVSFAGFSSSQSFGGIPVHTFTEYGQSTTETTPGIYNLTFTDGGYIEITLYGAGGGRSTSTHPSVGGAGGKTIGTILVSTGDVLTMVVGGSAIGRSASNYGGGGDSSTANVAPGGAGGGYSGVFAGNTVSHINSILISGGGGGGAGTDAGSNTQPAGRGGGLSGDQGSGSYYGREGTQSSGGIRGFESNATDGDGSALLGGRGGTRSTNQGCGGGGGGGYYGGGGGSQGGTGTAGQSGGTGGGGSGYIGGTSVINVINGTTLIGQGSAEMVDGSITIKVIELL